MSVGRVPSRIDPAQLRQIISQLKPGVVLRMYQPVAEKFKRHILIATAADRSIGFMINTTPGPFIAARPELLKRQVSMPLADHGFMHHDSSIACHDTVRLPAARDLAVGVWAQEIEILGILSPGVVRQIANAAKGSPLIADRDLELIVASFPP
jgi:hypothetical protein